MKNNHPNGPSTSTLGIDVRPTRTYFTLRTEDAVLHEEVPTKISITDDGILVGEDSGDGQSVLPANWTASEEGPDPEQLPLAVFFDRMVDRLAEMWDFKPQEKQSEGDVIPAKTSDGDKPNEASSKIQTKTVTDTETDADTNSVTDSGSTIPLPVDRTVVAVPGGFGHSEIAAVKQAVGAANLPVETVLRRPASTALSNLSFDGEQTAVVIDIDAEWCNVGVVTTSPDGTLDVDARLGTPGMGRREWLGVIAEAVVKQAGRSHNAVVEYDQRAIETVIDAVDEELASGDNTSDASPFEITLELNEGVELVLADRTLSETVTVDVSVDEPFVNAALEPYINKLQDVLTTPLTAAGIDRGAVDDVIIVGSGTRLHTIEEFLDGYFETPVRRPESTDGNQSSLRTPALVPPPAEPHLETETTDGSIELGACGMEGLETRPFSDALVAHDTTLQTKLRTREPTQSVGRFELTFHHPMTNELLDRRRFTVTGLPPNKDGTQNLTIEITVDRPTLTADTELDVTVTVDDEKIKVSSSDTENAKWLLHPDVDAEEAPAVGDQDGEDVTYARTAEPPSPIIDAAGKETVAKAVHELRTDLWDWGIKQERALESDNIEVVLNGLEKRLDHHGIVFFEPDIGTTLDPNRHYARESRESEEEEGAVVEVLKPGLEVEGRIVEKAIVAIAS